MYNFLKKIYYKYINYSDNIRYYGKYKGSFNKLRSFFWNFFHFKRISIRFKYNALFFNSPKKSNLKKKLLAVKPSENNDIISDEIFLNKIDDLFKNGGVVIENFFSPDVINNFLEKNKKYIVDTYKIESSPYNNAKMEIVNLSNELIKIWLNDKIIFIMETFFNSKIYARNYPHIGITKIDKKFTSKEKFLHNIEVGKTADDWHVDHSTLFNFHVILEDLTIDEPHMEYAEKSHLYFNSTSPYSQEEIDSKKFKIKKCIGKKGTVYLHYGNTLHRLNLIPSKKIRSVLHLEFTPGANLLLDTNNIVKSLKDGFNLDNLDFKKREILSGIYPLKLSKGYEYQNNIFKPNKYKGI